MLQKTSFIFVLIISGIVTTRAVLAQGTLNELDSIEAEANRVFEDCKASERMRTYYECTCFKQKYSERRREVGDVQSRDQIKFFVANNEFDCKNASGVANQKKSDCMRSSFMLSPDLKPRAKEYCDCYGEEYSKQYMELQERFSQKQDHLFSMKSTQACKKRVLSHAD